MKKVIILLTLFAFITAGTFAVNKVQAKVTKDVKIEMVKYDQDPVKAKDGDKTKKTDKTVAAPDLKSSAGQNNPPATNAPKSNVKPNYPKASKEACDTKKVDPVKK